MTQVFEQLAGYQNVLSAITSLERLQALRQFGKGYGAYSGFSLACIVVLLVLLVLLFIVNHYQKKYTSELVKDVFSDVARNKGLALGETQLLLSIAGKVRLKKPEMIFTMPQAFDKGMAAVLEDCLIRKQADQARRLKTELSFLREKLGFNRLNKSLNTTVSPRNLSSRQIPTEKVMHVIRCNADDFKEYECTVIRNTNLELAVSISEPFKSFQGDMWRVRCNFGALVCEFDATTIKSEADILVLEHNNNIRFINRRRFLRVPVRKAAYVASFPFSRKYEVETNEKGISAEFNADNLAGRIWGPPEFVPAVVTEIGGLGLRIDVPFSTQVGHKVIVALQLDEQRNKSLVVEQEYASIQSVEVVEGTGTVRDVKEVDGGFSIAVELTNLTDSNLAKLIRATNKASLRTGHRGQSPAALASEFLSNGVQERIEIPMVAQGV